MQSFVSQRFVLRRASPTDGFSTDGFSNDLRHAMSVCSRQGADAFTALNSGLIGGKQVDYF